MLSDSCVYPTCRASDRLVYSLSGFFYNSDSPFAEAASTFVNVNRFNGTDHICLLLPSYFDYCTQTVSFRLKEFYGYS